MEVTGSARGVPFPFASGTRVGVSIGVVTGAETVTGVVTATGKLTFVGGAGVTGRGGGISSGGVVTELFPGVYGGVLQTLALNRDVP